MKTLAYDLHLHSCLSPCGDNDMTPANIAGMAKIIGLDLIALTDHNSCKNCPAVAIAAREYGLLFLPGMELTTAEEVHPEPHRKSCFPPRVSQSWWGG